MSERSESNKSSCYALEDLINPPHMADCLDEFNVAGYKLIEVQDRNTHRHYNQHVYCPKGTNDFRKNNSRLDTVKRYPECYDVWEYHPA